MEIIFFSFVSFCSNPILWLIFWNFSKHFCISTHPLDLTLLLIRAIITTKLSFFVTLLAIRILEHLVTKASHPLIVELCRSFVVFGFFSPHGTSSIDSKCLIPCDIFWHGLIEQVQMLVLINGLSKFYTRCFQVLI